MDKWYVVKSRGEDNSEASFLTKKERDDFIKNHNIKQENILLFQEITNESNSQKTIS